MSDTASFAGTMSSGADSQGAADMAADLDAMDSGVDTAAEAPEEAAPEVEEAPPAVEEMEDTAEEDPPAEEPEPEAEASPEPTGEEAEDQVRERNGKKEYVLPEGRYQRVYAGYKATQAAEQIIGEELTPQAIEARHNAFVDQEAMIGDYLSGDPASEGRFLEMLAQWSQTAQESGQVQHSPLRSIASKIGPFLLQSGDREGFDQLAAPVTRALLEELYSEAVAEGTADENLFASLQRIENRLFGTYKKRAEVKAPDPHAKRQAELDARETKLNQEVQRRQQQEIRNWQEGTSAKVAEAIEGSLMDALGPNVAKAYEKFPTAFQGIKNLLRTDFNAALKKDGGWQNYLKAVGTKVANATPAARDAITAELQDRYKAKAKFWADPARNPKVKEILSQGASQIKAASDANHQRHAVGAARREPGGVGTPVRRTVAMTPNGGSTANDWAAAIDSL